MSLPTQVSPFQISIPDTSLQTLHQKLSTASFPDELDNAGWEYGAPLADVKRLVSHWRDKYDWRKAERQLNELPQYTTEIDVEGFGELKLHFVWKKSLNPKSVPLLYVHGWPGNFWEGSKIVNELGDDAGGGPAFDVVAPSLPNYGFSEGVSKKGFGLAQYAEACHKLMQKLGYEQYVTQGGDWGMYITRTMALLYPEYVKASHINMISALQPSFKTNPILYLQHALTPYTSREREGLKRTEWFLKEGSGYRAKQSTKPQTIGYALTDSPVALLSWIYEKLHDWTDSYPWTDDDICTWVSIYWFSTAGPAASLRIYYEATHLNPQSPVPASSSSSVQFQQQMIHRERLSHYISTVPLGLAFFPKELRVVPKTWARTLGPVIFESEYDKGGHFAAWERPDAIMKDLRSMFGKGGSGYGVVKGRDGYGREAKL